MKEHGNRMQIKQKSKVDRRSQLVADPRISQGEFDDVIDK